MKTVGLLQLGRPQVVIQFDVDNAGRCFGERPASSCRPLLCTSNWNFWSQSMIEHLQ